MENIDLMNAWKGVVTPVVEVMNFKEHPALRRMRRQMVIEAIGFALFLGVYYDFFDGDRKPLYANVILVSVMLLAVGNNLLGYFFTKQSVWGVTVKAAVERKLFSMKVFAGMFIGIRAGMMAGLLIYFSAVIRFTVVKYWMLAGIIVTFAVLLSFLIVLWRKRIQQLTKIIEGQ